METSHETFLAILGYWLPLCNPYALLLSKYIHSFIHSKKVISDHFLSKNALRTDRWRTDGRTDGPSKNESGDLNVC